MLKKTWPKMQMTGSDGNDFTLIGNTSKYLMYIIARRRLTPIPPLDTVHKVFLPNLPMRNAANIDMINLRNPTMMEAIYTLMSMLKSLKKETA